MARTFASILGENPETQLPSEPGGGGGVPGEMPPGPEESAGGCAPGTRPTIIREDGSIGTEATHECVSEEEYQRRLAIGQQYTPPGSGEPENSGGGGGGSPWKPAGAFPTMSPWTPGKAPTFETPAFTPPEGFQAPEFEWNKKLELTPFNLTEQYQPPDYQQATSDPGYQFRLKEGQRALENNAAARGTLRTGATLKGLSDYNQAAASQEYGNVFNRYDTGYNTRFGTAQKINIAQREKETQEYNAAFDSFVTEFQKNYTGKTDEWERNFKIAKEKFDTDFAARQIENTNRLQEFQTNEQARLRQWEIEQAANQARYFWNTPSATTIFQAGLN